MSTYSVKKQQLAQQIETHPALLAALNGSMSEGERVELIRLLMQYFRFEDMLTVRLDDVKNPADLAHEQELLSNSRYAFDGVSFMEAFENAIRYYDPQKGSFLACFTFCYKQNRSKTQDEQYRISARRSLSVSEKKARKLKKLLTLLSQTGRYRPENLPHNLYGPFARALDMDEDSFRELLTLAIQEQMAGNDPQPDDEDGNPAWMEQTIDKAADDAMMEPEKLDRLCALLDLLTDLDQREYPRLFMTNELIGTLKEKKLDAVEHKLYIQALAMREVWLWDHFFIQSYLDFIYAPELYPDSVRNLVLGQLIRKPIRSTIAAYKHVDRSAVSQSYKRFWSAFQSERMQRIQELLT